MSKVNDTVNISYRTPRGVDVELIRAPRINADKIQEKLLYRWSDIVPGGEVVIEEVSPPRSKVHTPTPTARKYATLVEVQDYLHAFLTDDERLVLGEPTVEEGRVVLYGTVQSSVMETIGSWVYRACRAANITRVPGGTSYRTRHPDSSPSAAPRKKRSRNAIPAGRPGIDRPYMVRVVVARTRAQRPKAILSPEIPHFLETIP